MSGMVVSPTDLHTAAEEFSLAATECQATMKRLEGAAADLENKWAGVTQQMFFQNYKEWRRGMAGFAALLTNISREMHAMAERFEQADR